MTTFTLEPAAGGSESTVTIQTDMHARTGFAGTIERWLLTQVLAPMYRDELRRLESVARSDTPTAP